MTQTLDQALMGRVEWCVARAASPIYRRYRPHVHVDDLRQQCWLWVLEHQNKAEELLEASDGFLVRRLRSVAERYARREKAVRTGYRPQDEHFYSLAQIVDLLPEALDPDATSGANNGSMEWETSIADIRGAVAALLPGARGRLVSWVNGSDMETTNDDIKSILRQIQMRLGGPRPTEGDKK